MHRLARAVADKALLDSLGLTMQIQHDGLEVLITKGPNEIGWLQVRRLPERHLNLQIVCLPDFRTLQARYPIDGLAYVTVSALKRAYRNKGIGLLMYLTAAREQAKRGYALTSEHCAGGKTSPMAQRVWTSLARSLPSEGSVVWAG